MDSIYLIPFGALVLGAQYVVRIGDRVMALAKVDTDEIVDATDQTEV